MGQLTHTTTEVDEQLDGVYAEIYEDAGSTPQTILTGSTPTLVTGFTSNGDSSHCTADYANNKITVTKTGEYLITITASFHVSAASDEWIGSVFADGVKLDDIHFEAAVTNQLDFIMASATGLHNFATAPEDLDFRVYHNNASSRDFTPTYMNLTVVRVGV